MSSNHLLQAIQLPQSSPPHSTPNNSYTPSPHSPLKAPYSQKQLSPHPNIFPKASQFHTAHQQAPANPARPIMPHDSLNQPLIPGQTTPSPCSRQAINRLSHAFAKSQKGSQTSLTKATLASLTNRDNQPSATPTSLPHRPTASAKARPIGPAKATVNRPAAPTAEQGHTFAPLPQGLQQLG